MNKLLTFLVLGTILISCNDGDIIITTFDFESTDLQFCSGNDTYLFFKINEGKTETLSLYFENTETLFITSDTLTIALNGSSSYVNYRIFDEEVTASYFCNEVPPTTPKVIEESFGNSGTAIITSVAIYDDADGISEEKESSLDTDGDGLLDYFDFDDDGDNVPTFLELDTENLDGDNDPFTNPKDSDFDGIADYLDEDDDGDGVLTRYEDVNQNLDPTDDISDIAVGPNYLNPNISKSIVNDAFREHPFNFTTSINVKIEDLVLTNSNEQVIYESLFLGGISELVSGTLVITPSF
ncbi:MAG: hypothetical protein R2781_02355 [Flavobacteriaceae bacterium]